MNNLYVVIMAGGIGSRFWPMSKAEFPKQFHDILGIGRTLIQQTADRFKNICPPENIIVVTNEEYKSLVQEQLPDIKEAHILTEPARRNTAPCVAYAAYKIKEENPDATMIVAPADHLILNTNEFEHIIDIALKQAKTTHSLVTLGIKPSRPDTGYGYIQFTDEDNLDNDLIKRVKTFTEKPDLALAEQFLDSGDFYWNAGIFIWTIKDIIAQFEQHLPDMAHLFEAGTGKYNTSQEAAFIENVYGICTNISIDYGIMEKANKVYVILSDFGWSDLGTWGSLYTQLDKDKNDNAVVGSQVRMYDSKNNVVHVPNNKLVVLQGLNDYIVVESDGVLLVCKKQEEQKIKQFVNDIKLVK